jgi:hypothetical protein
VCGAESGVAAGGRRLTAAVWTATAGTAAIAGISGAAVVWFAAARSAAARLVTTRVVVRFAVVEVVVVGDAAIVVHRRKSGELVEPGRRRLVLPRSD